jgi:hypothetical protein
LKPTTAATVVGFDQLSEWKARETSLPELSAREQAYAGTLAYASLALRSFVSAG